MNLSRIMHIMYSCFAPNSLIFWKSCCEEEEKVREKGDRYASEETQKNDKQKIVLQIYLSRAYINGIFL